MRLLYVACVAIALAACAAEALPGAATPEQLAASALARPGVSADYRKYAPVDVCDPAITNPYLIKECQQLSPDTQRRIDEAHRAEQHAVAERNAHAACVYQAQMASIMQPGLIGGLFAGIGAGNACENYYRNIGVMR